MKVGFITLLLLLVMGAVKAGDVSCQVDLLKPKIKAAVIIEETDKPATMAIAEGKLRLQNSRENKELEQQDQENHDAALTEDSEVTEKTAKKESRLGGIFDILLPSKLRNPVK